MKSTTITQLCCFFLFACSCNGSPSPFGTSNDNVSVRENVEAGVAAPTQRYLVNPVRTTGADPWVIQNGGKYYFSESDGGCKVYIAEFGKLSEMSKAQSKLVYDASQAKLKLNCLWGPHLNKINGTWYIYFCAQKNIDNKFTSQRMWVLKSSTDSPYGPYENMGEVLDSDNQDWAIDGSVLQKKNGELYFVWSGISKADIANGSLKQMSYIARMKDPTRIDRKTITLMSKPTEPWETSVRPIQEGQRPLYVDNNGKTIVMYSANASWTDEYCLGSLTNVDGDFLNPSSWTKSATPVFHKTSTVFGPGGASYVKSVDGKENWIIYHAAKHKGGGWDRNIRAQKFTFDKDNNPVFGLPVDAGVKMAVPSGE